MRRRWPLFVLAACLASDRPALAQEQANTNEVSDEQSAEQDTNGRTTNFMGLDVAPLTDPLVTDRPDFTESALEIPLGHAQLEMGYTFTADDEDGVRSADHGFPEALLRIGVAEHVEVRIGCDGWSLTEEITEAPNDAGRRVHVKDHDDGAADKSLGMKFHLLKQDGWQPEFGVIVELGLPTGNGTKTAGDVEPKVGLLWSYDINDWFALAGNVNFAVPNGEFGQFFQTSASLSAAFSLSDRVGMYTEYFGFYNNDRHSDAAHYLNGGFTYLINDNLQIDIRAGAGLNEEADDFFAGVGLAWRI